MLSRMAAIIRLEKGRHDGYAQRHDDGGFHLHGHGQRGAHAEDLHGDGIVVVERVTQDFAVLFGEQALFFDFGRCDGCGFDAHIVELMKVDVVVERGEKS